jgi:hypothetical protein
MAPSIMVFKKVILYNIIQNEHYPDYGNEMYIKSGPGRTLPVYIIVPFCLKIGKSSRNGRNKSGNDEKVPQVPNKCVYHTL